MADQTLTDRATDRGGASPGADAALDADLERLDDLPLHRQVLVVARALGSGVRAAAGVLRDHVPEMRAAVAEAGRSLALLGREVVRSAAGRRRGAA